jgi:hypothetical protein
VFYISALASYKLMGKETQLHMKVLSPEESGKDNYNGRWTFFINDIEYLFSMGKCVAIFKSWLYF